MTEAIVTIGGGCLCGAVRYRLASVPFDAGDCHCRICQKTSAGPVMGYGSVPVGDFILVQGAPKRRRSWDVVERWFCVDCGSPLVMRVHFQLETLDISLGSLDDLERVAPTFHLWTQSRITWFRTSDQFPRHKGFRPDTRGL